MTPHPALLALRGEHLALSALLTRVGPEAVKAPVKRLPGCVVTQIHDGDTVAAEIPLVAGLWVRPEPESWARYLRFAGCNARELSMPGGPEARDNLGTMLPVGTVLTLLFVELDKYGGRVQVVPLLGETDLVSLLIAQQWLAPWSGAGRGVDHLPPWPRTGA